MRTKQPCITLYTIGYSGHTVESFVETLHAQHIKILLDVRMTPISRKKGFSKTALSQKLQMADIRYLHLRSLGSPTALRKDLEANKNYSTFFDEYRRYLCQQEQGLQEAAQILASQPACLMCVEKLSDECHRSIVAEALTETSRQAGLRLEVKHLCEPDEHPIKTRLVARSQGSQVGKTTQQ